MKKQSYDIKIDYNNFSKVLINIRKDNFSKEETLELMINKIEDVHRRLVIERAKIDINKTSDKSKWLDIIEKYKIKI